MLTLLLYQGAIQVYVLIQLKCYMGMVQGYYPELLAKQMKSGRNRLKIIFEAISPKLHWELE